MYSKNEFYFEIFFIFLADFVVPLNSNFSTYFNDMIKVSVISYLNSLPFVYGIQTSSFQKK